MPLDINDLCLLVESGNLDAVKQAVGEGSLVNEYSAKGLTPLGTAVVCAKTDIIQHLLVSGANIQLGYKAELCKEKSHVLSTLPAESPPIHCAVATGSTDIVRLLVDFGADVNDASGRDYGSQILPLFVSKGKMTKFLLDQGADVSRKSSTGFTALLHALAREDTYTVQVLVDNGADVNVERITKYRIRDVSESGELSDERLVDGTSSPLMVACHQGRLRATSGEMIRILASAGANVDRRYFIKDTDISFTVLSLICASRVPTPRLKGAFARNDIYGPNEVAAIEALILAGANPNNDHIITFLCHGIMPFSDFQFRLAALSMLMRNGAIADSEPGYSPQSALLDSFTPGPESELQFTTIATLLASSGFKWNRPQKPHGNGSIPAYLQSDN